SPVGQVIRCQHRSGTDIVSRAKMSEDVQPALDRNGTHSFASGQLGHDAKFRNHVFLMFPFSIDRLVHTSGGERTAAAPESKMIEHRPFNTLAGQDHGWLKA